ncbi:uncharacterized protein PGTG_00546 [Puccinia graminis f. sp. tritici CRL 75-36-700-3]|uniref:Uncharacterized protein n=1 Tax=Puccinia graminis f. sp. tritici (strain CRL 75-36-700-3 / race SCCL) TaxID=418459 RepID=E3JRC6_PUCGT|nr:uncharacterized protein PGTG_00546 [Puccinia graminis f. sp. tritici CRL 75-36-700-3]EFP74590.2 hypothetical protein PGTG_00546 [Puccinia graminis f. sp. tritici CRL 75-36-700-3]
MTIQTGSLHTVRNRQLTPRRDYLCFSGQFKGELGPFLQARPNQGPLEMMKSSVYTSGKWKTGPGQTTINVTCAYHEDFALSVGGPQRYNGKITKMDNDSVLSFQLSDGETIENVGQERGRTQGVTIDGVGSIVESWTKEVEQGANSKTSFVVVEHDVNASQGIQFNRCE